MTDFSYQLYSSRNFPPLTETLKMLDGLGYAQVEGFGSLYGPGEDPVALRDALDANGLTMPTCHMALDVVENAPTAAIATARTLGCIAIFVPHITKPDRPSDAVGWAALGKRLAEAGKPILDSGIKLGWHNHEFEFADLGGTDKPLDLILAGSDDISLELDLAWVKVSGEDPVEWIMKFGSRLVAAHIKDIAPDSSAQNEDGWADVGHGVMEWDKITDALRKTSVEYLVMEHDNPNDHERFARRSLAAAQKFWS